MFKLTIVLAAMCLTAVSAGLLGPHHVAHQPILANVGHVVHSVPSAVSHQSITQVHSSPVIQHVVAPVHHSHHVAPVVHHSLHAAPLVHHSVHAAPWAHSHHAAPVVHSVHSAPLVLAPVHHVSAPIVHSLHHHHH